jgi:hypothetical protein
VAVCGARSNRRRSVCCRVPRPTTKGNRVSPHFGSALQNLGWTEGRNVRIEHRLCSTVANPIGAPTAPVAGRLGATARSKRVRS